jgi:hypothetical protein
MYSGNRQLNQSHVVTTPSVKIEYTLAPEITTGGSIVTRNVSFFENGKKKRRRI